VAGVGAIGIAGGASAGGTDGPGRGTAGGAEEDVYGISGSCAPAGAPPSSPSIMPTMVFLNPPLSRMAASDVPAGAATKCGEPSPMGGTAAGGGATGGGAPPIGGGLATGGGATGARAGIGSVCPPSGGGGAMGGADGGIAAGLATGGGAPPGLGGGGMGGAGPGGAMGVGIELRASRPPHPVQ